MADEGLVWCDVRRNIGVLQFILGVKEPGRGDESCAERIDTDTAKVVVKSNCVVVKRKDDATGHARKGKTARSSLREIRILFQGVKVDPITCNGLTLVKERELHMRLRLRKDDTASGLHMSCINLYSKQLDKERCALQQGPVKICCKMCLENVTETMQFDRVLELPSELWQQTSLNLCCHGTITNLPSLQQGSLNPAERDCFLSSYFFLLHSNAVESKHLDNKSKKVFKCQRCSWPIGVKVAEHDEDSTPDMDAKCIRINKHAVVTGFGSKNIFREYTTEQYLSRLLYTKLQGRVNFKFLVKSSGEKGARQTCVILWILNPEAAILTNIKPKTSAINNYVDECSIGERSEIGKERANLIKGMKILYKFLLNITDEEMKTLPENMESFTLPMEEFVQLVLFLTGSTHTMPPSQRQVKGFTVGYLKI